jgi:hypothetical protein
MAQSKQKNMWWGRFNKQIIMNLAHGLDGDKPPSWLSIPLLPLAQAPGKSGK